MTNKRKSLHLLTVLTLVTVVTACSSGNQDSSPTPVSSTSPASTASQPVPVRIFMSDFSQPVPGGASMDNPTLKYLAQKTNTIVDMIFLQHAQFDQQLTTKYASGDIADVVMGWSIGGELMANDQLIALNEYIDKYGANLKKMIPQAAWDAVTLDGKIYAIPEAAAGNVAENKVLYVRKDWMDKVGIKEVPKTPDELLVMLRAFRDNDPNGNGKKDEIAFSARENMSWLDNIFGMYGQTQFTAKFENNELVPGFVSSDMKKGLGFLRQMMQEKLLDSEFMTNKRNVWEQKIQQGIVGMWNHDVSLAWDWQDRLNQSLPNEKPNVIAIPTPKEPGVKNAGSLIAPTNKVFMVTKKAKDPAAIVKLFDWLVTQEGQEFVNLGIPGDTYTKNGSQITYDKQKDTNNKTVTWRSPVLNIAGYNEELLKIKLGNDQAFEKQKIAYTVGQNESIPNVLQGLPPIKTNQPEVPNFGFNNSALYMEAATQIILGEKPLDFFDEFVKKYRSLGGNEVIGKATEWYKSKNK